MARSKHKSPRRKSQSKKLNPFIGPSLRRELQQDAAQKLRALQRYGFVPGKTAQATRLSDRRITEINKAFNKANKHGTFVNGKTERLFRATKNGYTLNRYFAFTEQKISPRSSIGAIHTTKGTILQTLGKDSRIVSSDEKTGRITYREKLEGQYHTIHSAPASPEWILDFIKRVKNGRYKFPKGYAIRLTFFDFGDKQSQLLYNTAQIRRTLTARRRKHPTYELNVVNALKTGVFRMRKGLIDWRRANIEPMKLEFIELTSASFTP